MAIFSCLKRAKTQKTDYEMVTFPRLDYWSMLDLFDCIPVHDLVRLNGLASWWSGYVTKVCRTKRSITVKCGEHDEYNRPKTGDGTQDQFNLLKVTYIDSHTSDRLVRLLPSITSLEIIIEAFQPYDIDDITYLISKWSHQLVSLKIKCLSDYAHVPEDNLNIQINQLLLSLNTITSLRRLTIDCKWWKCSAMQEPIDLSILSFLKYIYFHTGDHDFPNLRQSLVQYAGPNHNLKQIELPTLFWFLPSNDLFDHQFVSKLTMLEIDFGQFSRDHWALFSNLVTVDLGFVESRSEFMEAITGMQCLKLIRNLSMTINRVFDGELDQVPVDLPQLPSVTNLKLETRVPTNSYFKSLQLGTIFPNVESIHFDYAFFDSKISSSGCVVKWMAQTWSKIRYRMHKRRVRREFAGVECIFKPKYHYF